MKKYAHSLLRYFLIYAIGFIPFYLLTAVVDIVYGILSDKMPNVFPTYNALTDKASLLSLEATLALFSAVFTVLILTVFAVKYDNERYEYIISETDGFYTLGSGFRLYVKEYLRADILSAVLIPVPFLVLDHITFPEESAKALRMLEDTLGTLASPTVAFTDKLGPWLGAAVLLAISLLTRAPAAYMGLKRWRGLWLSNIDG